MYKDNSMIAPPCMSCCYGMDFTQEAFDKALELIKEAVQDERADELMYSYFISVAPTQEEKDIITSIRNDERNHRKWFREIYKFYTGEDIEAAGGEEFKKPSSYIEGISNAVFGELKALEKYRFIREGLPSRLYRDIVFRILTDEIKHSIKYNYILNKNSNAASMMRSNGAAMGRTKFSKEEAAAIALLLGIDFAKTKFDLNQFWMGVNIELEHGKIYDETNVTSDNPLLTGKIALAHLNEFPDYYTRLAKLEDEAKVYWSSR